MTRSQYDEIWHDRERIRAFVDGWARLAPELFPAGFDRGYRLHGFGRESRKLPGLKLRKVVTDDGSSYWLRPSFIAGYMTGTADELAYPLLLAAHGVPPWLLKIGFPHGGHATAVKLFEAGQALDDGATELDMVINIGQAIGGHWQPIEHEIGALTKLAHERSALVKVIFENCYLNDDQKTRLCAICGQVGADFVKTSTGYGTGGATHDDLRLMRRASPPHVKLKAAGGVRTLEATLEVIGLGCERIGLSKTQEILDDLKQRLARGDRPEIPFHVEQSTLGGAY